VSLVYIQNFFALFVSSKLGLQDENLLSAARLKKKEFNKKNEGNIELSST